MPEQVGTAHCIPPLPYRCSVGVYRTVWNGYTVTVQWLVKTVQCSLPMCFCMMDDLGVHHSFGATLPSAGFGWHPRDGQTNGCSHKWLTSSSDTTDDKPATTQSSNDFTSDYLPMGPMDPLCTPFWWCSLSKECLLRCSWE